MVKYNKVARSFDARKEVWNADLAGYTGAGKRSWLVYIPEEGHWSIPGKHNTRAEARAAYLVWAKRTRMPAGSFISEGEMPVVVFSNNG